MPAVKAVPDLVLLERIEEDAIRECLKQRHASNDIYTFIGDVLISVNPFQKIRGIYAPEKVEEYHGRYNFENPPHIYAVAEDANRGLRQTQENQCIIISGESGAGKTEAAKLIMKYISAVSGERAEIKRVNDQLLASNPVLEAFGNAKTNRNDNSSRFGKYLEIVFDFSGDPVGGKIQNYLLEKSRVVNPMSGERDFHIFYQLLAGLPENEKKKYHLREPQFYNYLNKSGTFTVDTINDANDYKETVQGMLDVGFQQSEIDDLKASLAAILWIGQVTFTQNEKEEAQINDMEPIKIAAELLRVTPDSLAKSLLSAQLNAAGELTQRKLDLEKAEYTRDSLCKNIYSRTFDWLVARINRAIDPRGNPMYDPKRKMTIGVLDIYGFEIFDNNSFEQFCINYVNEKLQQIFIEQTLKKEQQEYADEGIQWVPVEYFNNRVVCELIEATPKGIFAFLDEECTMPRGSDATFHTKIFDHLGSHPHLLKAGAGKVKTEASDKNYVIKHFAGDVEYITTDFTMKNKDLVWKDLILLGESSGLELFSELYPKGASDKFSKKRPVTQATQFRTQVFSLVGALEACVPHYVRCIKPNDFKRANHYDNERVSHQIKYLGLLENVRVRRAGFAFRMDYVRFLNRYKMICKDTWPLFNGGERDGTDVIVRSLGWRQGTEYQLGKSKIFIKEPNSLFKLDDLRNKRILEQIAKMQAAFRGHKQEIWWKKHKAVRGVQTAFRAQKQRTWYKEYCGARALQTTWRAYDQRKWYLDTCAARLIQAQWRGRQARKYAQDYAAARTIQRVYQVWRYRKGGLRERAAALELYGNQKKRRRFSATRFLVGDVLDMANNQEFAQISQQKQDGSKVVFSDFVDKINRKFKVEPRVFVLTEKSIFLLKYLPLPITNPPRAHLIEKLQFSRQHAVRDVNGLSVSPFPDNYFVLRVESDGDTLYQAQRKTELMVHISKATPSKIKPTVDPSVEFKIKNKVNRIAQFQEVESKSDEVQVVEGKNTLDVRVPSSIPTASQKVIDKMLSPYQGADGRVH